MSFIKRVGGRRAWRRHGAQADAAGALARGESTRLGATAAGLASFWSSPPTRAAPTALALVGFEPDTQLVGVVYLGWPAGEASPPARPELVITRVA